MDGLFQKTVPWTKQITLKNFQGKKSRRFPEKTFDYMLLWDTKKYMIGICDWSACMKNLEIKDANIAFRVDMSDVTIIAQDIIPLDKGDIGQKLFQLLETAI